MSALWPQIPREPRPGEQPAAVTLIQIIRCLRFILPRLPATPPPGRRGGASDPVLEPFTLVDASAGETLKVGIVPGTVNGISPTFTGAAPAGVLSDVPPPLLTITATTWFWLQCIGVFSTTFGVPDTYTVSIETSATSAAPASEAISGTGFTSCYCIGKVVVVSGAIVLNPSDQYVSSNMGVESFGNLNDWWRL